MVYNLFPKFHVIHETFSFYGYHKSEEGVVVAKDNHIHVYFHVYSTIQVDISFSDG